MSHESDALYQQTEALNFIHNRLEDIADALRCVQQEAPVKLVQVEENTFINPKHITDAWVTCYSRKQGTSGKEIWKARFHVLSSQECLTSKPFSSKEEAVNFILSHFDVLLLPITSPSPTQEN